MFINQFHMIFYQINISSNLFQSIVIYFQVIMQRRKNVGVLFLGTLNHQEETIGYPVKTPQEDEIEFQKPVLIELIRIPKSGNQLYQKCVSSNQSELIKGFEIYFRNLSQGNARFSLLTSNNELLAGSTDDILITPKQPVYTDLLVIRGSFYKITLCIYGCVVEESLMSQKCRFYLQEIPIEIQQEKSLVQLNRNVFEESSGLVRAIEESVKLGNTHLNLDYIDCWHEITNDDENNETQIRNISNISQTLLKSLSTQNISQEKFKADFRCNLEELTNILAKIFKSKHLGLYYPSPHRPSALHNHIPLGLTHIGLFALDLSRSDQIRSLQLLRLVLQLQQHAKKFVQCDGVFTLIKLFVDFFLSSSVSLSTFKNLLIEVLIVLAQWKFAVQAMITKIQDDFYIKLFLQPSLEKDSESQKAKNKEKKGDDRQLERSRNKARRKKSDNDSDDDQQQKKRRKQKKRKEEKRSKSKQKSKKDRQRQKSKHRDKSKQKQKKKSKSSQKKIQQNLQVSLIKVADESVGKLSFFEIIFKMMKKDINIRQLDLLKILMQQITQTITKDPQLSNIVAITTGYLRQAKQFFVSNNQIISNKSLKMFAAFQPFLNSVQSEGVKCEYAAEVEKAKTPLYYKMDPKIYKLINAINWKIASRQQDQQIMTQYDEQFITLMSAMITSEKTTSSGLNRIIAAFKVDNILQLKKQQAIISIMCQYIYKVLLQDEGITTALYIDQIHSALLKISNWFSEDTSFSREIKRRIKFLSNYAMSYDHLTGTEGIFKTFSDYFLRIFKYQHFEINKISDFRSKQFEKLMNPMSFNNLQQNFKLGSFYDLLPNQPLLQIFVCLKIFWVLTEFNNNIWTMFYQHKLISGFSLLFHKLSSIIIFLIKPSCERQAAITEIKYYQKLIDNYLSVNYHLLKLLCLKCRYEVAFNELIQQDNFEDADFYQKCLELYVALQNAQYVDDSLISSQITLNKLRKNIALLLEIFDNLLISFQLTNNTGRQAKIKRIIKNMYMLHYESIMNRPAVVKLLGQFIDLSLKNCGLGKQIDGNCSKIIGRFLVSQDFQKDQYYINPNVVLLPNNERSIIQNLIRVNLYRSDIHLRKSLAELITALLKNNFTSEFILKLIQSIFEEVKQGLKGLQDLQNTLDRPVAKLLSLFELLADIDFYFKNKLEEKIVKFLKVVDQQIEKISTDRKADLQLYCHLRKAILRYLAKNFKNMKDTQNILFILKVLSKLIDTPTPQEITDEKLKIWSENCLFAIQLLSQLSVIPYHQSIILYGEYLQTPYKPMCQITFDKLLTFINDQKNILVDKYPVQTGSILVKIFSIICNLTTVDHRQFYSTQSRRNSIIALVGSEKEFPFSFYTSFENLVPKEFIQLLKDYFNFPVVDKSLADYQMVDEKQQITKGKAQVFSKAVFDMVSQGQPVSKPRYEFICAKWMGGKWIGGDTKTGIFHAFKTKNYLQMVENETIVSQNEKKFEYLILPYQITHQPIQINELFAFYTKKTEKDIIQRKIVDSTIALKKINSVLKDPQQFRQSSRTIISPLHSMQSQHPYMNSGSKQQLTPSIQRSPPPNKMQQNQTSPSTIQTRDHRMTPMQNPTLNRTPSNEITRSPINTNPSYIPINPSIQQNNLMQYNNPQSTTYQQSIQPPRVQYQNPPLNMYENSRMGSNPMTNVYPNQIHGGYNQVSQHYNNPSSSNSYYPPNRPIGHPNSVYNYGGNSGYNQSYPQYQQQSQQQQTQFRLQIPSFLSPQEGAMYVQAIQFLTQLKILKSQGMDNTQQAARFKYRVNQICSNQKIKKAVEIYFKNNP